MTPLQRRVDGPLSLTAEAVLGDDVEAAVRAVEGGLLDDIAEDYWNSAACSATEWRLLEEAARRLGAVLGRTFFIERRGTPSRSPSDDVVLFWELFALTEEHARRTAR